MAASESFRFASWAVESDYQRLQELVIRFGLDALPERPAVVSRSDGGDLIPWLGPQAGRGAAESGAGENPQSRRSLMSRRSVFLGWLAVAALASIARLRAQEEPAKPTQIVLRPAAAPVPALKYQLLPEHRTLVPGNAAIFYHRAVELMLDRTHRPARQEANRGFTHRREGD